MILKVDTMKDYELFGFRSQQNGLGGKRRRWNASFFMLVNGSCKGYFKSTNDIRQGEPLSPRPSSW